MHGLPGILFGSVDGEEVVELECGDELDLGQVP